MIVSKRHKILSHNQLLREGRLPPPRRLDDGEVVFKIPERDMRVLHTIYPELISKDPAVRLKAWHDFRKTPIAEQYLVTRTPKQVQRSPRGIIVR